MAPMTVLVIDNPQAEHLKPRRHLPEALKIVISDQLEVLQKAAPEAEVIMMAGDEQLLCTIFPKAVRLRWLHSFSAGVEAYLFPEVVESPVVMTNARGVFKKPLIPSHCGPHSRLARLVDAILPRESGKVFKGVTTRKCCRQARGY
jgi:phosphoglycerate dehydrogenase-like enzyme